MIQVVLNYVYDDQSIGELHWITYVLIEMQFRTTFIVQMVQSMHYYFNKKKSVISKSSKSLNEFNNWTFLAFSFLMLFVNSKISYVNDYWEIVWSILKVLN